MLALALRLHRRHSRNVPLGWKHFRMLAAMPRVYTDAQLKRITPPTLLILGEHELIYRNTHTVIGRALRVLPNVEVAWVPGAVHVPTIEQPAWVNPRVLRFLNNDVPAIAALEPMYGLGHVFR